MRTFAIRTRRRTDRASPALADEQVIKLKPGARPRQGRGQLPACHSLAYIPMNSPFLNAAGWDAAVNKMINALGAPIDDGRRQGDQGIPGEELRQLKRADSLTPREIGPAPPAGPFFNGFAARIACD